MAISGSVGTDTISVPDDVIEAVRFIKSLGFGISINTNGTVSVKGEFFIKTRDDLTFNYVMSVLNKNKIDFFVNEGINGCKLIYLFSDRDIDAVIKDIFPDEDDAIEEHWMEEWHIQNSQIWTRKKKSVWESFDFKYALLLKKHIMRSEGITEDDSHGIVATASLL